MRIRTSRLGLHGLVIACGLLMVVVAPCYGVPDTDGKGSMFGKEAPGFRIKGAYGETYSLEAFQGNVVVLQFGTSW